MMPWPDRRRDWTEIRQDYYVSARNLMGKGFFHSAGILLAYAVETHLQASLYEAYKGDQVAKVGEILKKNTKLPNWLIIIGSWISPLLGYRKNF